MHYKHWTFEQTTPATLWAINNVPTGAEGAVITHIITNTGQILQPDNQTVAPYGLDLSFGVEAIAGIAYGNYYLEEEEQQEVVVNGNGGSISVVINQHNGGAESQQSS